jgi:hypothetical protein
MSDKYMIKNRIAVISSSSHSGLKNRRGGIFVVITMIVIIVTFTHHSGINLDAGEPVDNKPLSVGEKVELKRGAIVRTALSLSGSPYRYGGTTPAGFDCCGFVMYVYRRNGVMIPRTASAQYCDGRSINPDDLKKGDLVFFNIRGKGVSHVGLYIGDGKFIHSPVPGRRVSVERLEWQYWKRRFLGAATYFD